MTTDDLFELRVDLKELRQDVATVAQLQREANGRLGTLEGKVFEVEMWRARMQGVAATSRVVWAVAGGAVTALIVELIR